MSEKNKDLVRRYIREVAQEGNVDAIDKYFSADYINHSAAPGQPRDREGRKAFAAMVASALSDDDMTIEDLIAEGDKVVTRWSRKSTHSGELMGVPATGKKLTVTGMGIVRIVDGKIVEEWGQTDMMGLMQQLGVIPTPQAA